MSIDSYLEVVLTAHCDHITSLGYAGWLNITTTTVRLIQKALDAANEKGQLRQMSHETVLQPPPRGQNSKEDTNAVQVLCQKQSVPAT